MPISYPLTMPIATRGITSITFLPMNSVGITNSPFTYQSQVLDFGGKLMTAEVTVDNLMPQDADVWLSFLMSLKGKLGTFLLGDPLKATASGFLGGTPVVDLANQTGDVLNIRGATANITNWLRAGDYIQLGTNNSSRLYRVLNNVNTNATGRASIDIWPNLRSSPADAQSVITSNPRGSFRLTSDFSWVESNNNTVSTSFTCQEAL
jgi:hypothetical protein